MGVETLRADEFSRRGVLGDLRAERLDSAAGLDDVAPPEHRLALGKTKAAASPRHIAIEPRRY